tara:strand:- start:142 stop:735 length:594 start_codon:yes stop_codon:yes gene_type:complete
MKLLILSMILMSQLFSQNVDEIKSDWSIYAGLSSMSASADSYDYETVDPGRKVGFNFGVIRAVSKKLDVGVGYTQRGWTDSAYYVDLGMNIDEDWSLSGIDIFATYDLFEFGNGGSVWAGPSFTILTSVEAEFKASSGETISDETEIDDNDISILIGASIPLGGSGSNLSVGYQRSIIEVDNFIFFNQLFARVSFSI